MPEIVLTPQDKKYLVGKYKELYGELTNDDESKQRFLELSDKYVNYKDKVLTQQSDEAINNYFTKPWKSDINQAQNAFRFKTGVPISSLNDQFEAPIQKQPKQPKPAQVAQVTQPQPEPKKVEQIQNPTFWQRLTEQGAYTPEEQQKMAKRAEQSAMGVYGTNYVSHLTRSLWNGLGTIATGRIMDLFPGGSDISRNIQEPLREQLYKKYFLEPGEQLNYKPGEVEKAKTSETARNISGLAGDLTAFFVPVAGEEKIAAGAAELLPKATTWFSRYMGKVAGSAAHQLPKAVPIMYAQNLDKGAQMGLSGEDLNKYARLNTALTWASYSFIPNVFTGGFKANDKIVKTLLNPNASARTKQLLDIATRATGSGLAGTAAGAGDIAATNLYGPEGERKDFSNIDTWKDLGQSFLTNAIIHTGFEARNIANASKASNIVYTNMVADMAMEKDKTAQLIKQSVEKGTTTKEDGDKAIALLDKIEPHVKTAMGMPGVKPAQKGVTAFELARLEDLVKERNKQTTPDAIQEYNNKIDKSLEQLNSLQNGTNFKGVLAKPEEITDMVAKHTPQGRLSPTQVFRMSGEYGFKQNSISPEYFKGDPTVQEYIQQFKDGTLTPEENTSGMPIVLDSNGGIIDGKKRIAKQLFDAEQNKTSPNSIEVLSPISESEIADGISDLNAVNPMKQAEYARAKELEFMPAMAEQKLTSTGKVSGVEFPGEGKKLNMGDAVSKVYHTAKENALAEKQPITEQDILDNALTGEYDGQDISDVVKDFLARYEATDESLQPSMMKAFVDEINKSKDAIKNPNVTAFRAAVEFALKAGVPKENLAKTLEGALGVKQQYIDGYLKVLDKKGLMPEVSKRNMFKPTEAKQPNVEMPEKSAPKKEAVVTTEAVPESTPEAQSNYIRLKKFYPNSESTELTERQIGSVEKAISKSISEGKSAEETVAILNALGFAPNYGSETNSLLNYIKARIEGKETRTYNEIHGKFENKADLGGEKPIVENEKADIERRRQEELNSLPLVPLSLTGELTEGQKRNILEKEKINAKYDAELAALEEAKPTEEVKPTVEEVKPTERQTTSNGSGVEITNYNDEGKSPEQKRLDDLKLELSYYGDSKPLQINMTDSEYADLLKIGEENKKRLEKEIADLEESLKSPQEEPVKTRKEEVEYQIEQLEKAKEDKVKSLMDNGASRQEAEKIAEAEMPKADKKALKILKKELDSFTEKPVPLPEESDAVTSTEAPGSFDDSIALEPEEPVAEEPIVEVEISDKELKDRKNEIIKSTNRKNLKDIFDTLEKEGLLERDPKNTKDCI